jgi:phosphonate metabolism-associated iron-containing alcohol dehydrogenase
MIFHNPVRVEWGTPDFEWLPALIRGRHAAVVSTKGMEERGIIERVTALINQANLPVVSTVHPNPTVASIREHAAKLLEARDVEVIVAIGGGSVMDTAKGIAAIASGGFSADWFASHLREGAEFPTAFAPPAVIAVPTTAGTGSEVTMWGTVWDEETGAKYSISHPKLYAERAVLVPELTATMPPDLTLYSALDALSPCMESIWNRNTNAVSEAFATAGLAKILPNLDNVLRNPDDFEARRRLQEAALLGGLAISCTKTALAHSISYPLTSRLGMPHGLARLRASDHVCDGRGHGQHSAGSPDALLLRVGCTEARQPVPRRGESAGNGERPADSRSCREQCSPRFACRCAWRRPSFAMREPPAR